MPKIRNPLSFSVNFGVSSSLLDGLGVLDPTLNADTKLFIDPMLLSESSHTEMSNDARKSFEDHFTLVIKFLSQSKTRGDVAWKTATKLLTFPEVKWTCLGYGASSIHGSGSGTQLTAQYIDTAKQIVDLGITDPDLFVAMALFEEGVGPDRLSDMTTKIILKDIVRLNERILPLLGVPTKKLTLMQGSGEELNATLAVNPSLGPDDPVLLVPSDVLRALPVVKDWEGIADAASKNAQLRARVNNKIAKLWKTKSLKAKAELKKWALSDKATFETFMEMVRGADKQPYDLKVDPLGEVFWRRIASELTKDEPFKIQKPTKMDLADVENVVQQIIDQFRFLIEKRRYSEELYQSGKPRPEIAAQRLFFAVALTYCKANDLDLTPEAETGNGPVDFKVSTGFNVRVVVEIKLSKNSKLVAGYTKQLEAYKTAEETISGFYVVVDVGSMGRKDKALFKAKNEAIVRGEETSKIELVDGTLKKSASKL